MDITVAKSAAGINAIAEVWDSMTIPSPHADRSLFTLVVAAAGQAMRPHVMLIRRGSADPPILVVCRVERRPMVVKAGYRTLFSLPASRLVVVAGGVAGAAGPGDYDLVLRTLLAQLRRERLDVLELARVEVGGPLHQAALRHLPRLRRGHAMPALRHHRSDLSGGFDAFLAARSKGTRWRIRKRLRKLADATAEHGKMTVRQLGTGEGVDESVRMLDRIARRSYQRGIGVGFTDDELHRSLLTWAGFRVWILFVDDTPVAYVDGVLHERTFHLFETAFDQTLADDEPGAVLLAKVLEELAADPQVDHFDYGYGDAQYKQSLSDMSAEDTDVVGFALRPRPIAASLVAGAAAGAVSVTKRVLGGERVARLRRRRREQLAAGDD